ncbi:MAG: hypothetical protein ABRQ25_18365 [Clostridiaceae bacterium]
MKRLSQEKQRIINGGAPYTYVYNGNHSYVGGNINAPVTVVQLITNIMTKVNVNVNVKIGNIGPH